MKIKYILKHKTFVPGDIVEVDVIKGEKIIKDGYAKRATFADITKNVVVRPMRVINKKLNR